MCESGDNGSHTSDLTAVLTSFIILRTFAPESWMFIWVLAEVSRACLQPIDSDFDLIDVREIELPYHRPVVTDDFDPRDHRNPAVPIKPWMAYFNLLRMAVGAGMLGMPLAISQAGLVVGPLLALAVGLLFVHTHMTLLWCLNEISRQLKIPSISYRYGFRLALLHGPPLLHVLGHNGPLLIALFMTLSHLGICTATVIFIADNIRDMMDWSSSDYGLLLLLGPIMILEILMNNLKIISKVVMTANALNSVALVLVMYKVLSGPRREDYSLVPHNPTSFLLAIGIMFFNMSAVGVIVSCERALKRPQLMYGLKGIICVGLMVPTIVCIAVGMLGSWAFGVMEENLLRYLDYDDRITSVCFVLYTFSMALTYPLSCFPALQIISEVIQKHDPKVLIQATTLQKIEFVARPIFLLCSFVIAYYLPFQGPYVAFVGCMCTTMTCVVFPALMEIGLCYPSHYGRFDYILVKDLLLVLLGCVIFFTGINLCGDLLSLRLQYKRSPVVKTDSDNEKLVINNMRIYILAE